MEFPERIGLNEILHLGLLEYYATLDSARSE